MDNLVEVFGENLSVRWLLPCGEVANAYSEHVYTSVSTLDNGEETLRIAPRIDMVPRVDLV